MAADTPLRIELLSEPNEDDMSPLPPSLREDGNPPEAEEDEAPSTVHAVAPSVAVLYLVSSSLRLGAIFLSSLDTRVAWSILLPALLIVAFLTLITIQVWIRMAQYTNRSTVADVVADAVVGPDGGMKYRKVVKTVVRTASIVTNVLLCAVYMRVFLDTIMELLAKDVGYRARLPLTVFLSLIASSCMGATLASKRVVFLTAASVLAYAVSLGLHIAAHVTGVENHPAPSPTVRPWMNTWESISVIQFAFASPFVLPVYALLARPPASPDTQRTKRSQSFTTLSITAVFLSVALLVPLVFLAPDFGREQDSTMTQLALSPENLAKALEVSRGVAIVLAVPSVMSVLPTPNSASPASRSLFSLGLRSQPRRLLWRATFLCIITILALLPKHVSRIIRGVAIVLCLIGSYFLPGVLHVLHHQLRKPQSIIFPGSGSSSYTLFAAIGDESEADALLLRKEHSLQRRRLARRLVWDISVWVVLLPLSLSSIVWAGGRCAGRW